MANIVPEKGLDFKVYLNGSDMLGVAEGNFPTIEFMTSEVKGAGIAGAMDSVGVGHINSMAVSLTWRNIQKSITKLLQPGAHNLELHAAHQDYNASLGTFKITHIYVFMKAITKSANLGNLVIGDVTDTQTEHEVYYMRMQIDGEDVLEIDKYNYVYKVHGVDYMTEVRRALGMAV